MAAEKALNNIKRIGKPPTPKGALNIEQGTRNDELRSNVHPDSYRDNIQMKNQR